MKWKARTSDGGVVRASLGLREAGHQSSTPMVFARVTAVPTLT